MRREDLPELHYITPINNVRSIFRHGILSHNGVAKLEHESIAMDEIHERRESVVIPGGRPLHDCVNLFIHARNPMMYKRQEHHARICVLRINTEVLDLPGVVIADRNASTDMVRFAPSPQGLSIVDKELAFAEWWWVRDDPIQTKQRGQVRSAEVLVPNRVETKFSS